MDTSIDVLFCYQGWKNSNSKLASPLKSAQAIGNKSSYRVPSSAPGPAFRMTKMAFNFLKSTSLDVALKSY